MADNNDGRVRDAVLEVKLDTAIEEIRKANGKLDNYAKRTEALEIGQARLDERLTNTRNLFVGLQAAITGALTFAIGWLGFRRS